MWESASSPNYLCSLTFVIICRINLLWEMAGPWARGAALLSFPIQGWHYATVFTECGFLCCQILWIYVTPPPPLLHFHILCHLPAPLATLIKKNAKAKQQWAIIAISGTTKKHVIDTMESSFPVQYWTGDNPDCTVSTQTWFFFFFSPHSLSTPTRKPTMQF